VQIALKLIGILRLLSTKVPAWVWIPLLPAAAVATLGFAVVFTSFVFLTSPISVPFAFASWAIRLVFQRLMGSQGLFWSSIRWCCPGAVARRHPPDRRSTH